MTISDKLVVLDHGYVKFIEDWGHGESDVAEAGIIEAARMSTNKGFASWKAYYKCKVCGALWRDLPDGLWQVLDPHQRLNSCCDNSPDFLKNLEKMPGDEKLLAFLYSKKHMSPFEMAGMTIEIESPIMVLREWHRHRTQSYNEMSGRYIQLPDVNYVPSVQRVMIGQASTTNRQAQRIGISGFEVTKESIEADQADLDHYYAMGQGLYQRLLDRGWPKELARLPVTVGRYSRMRASGNLRNWLAFLTLRMDPAAQWEIRQYANTVGNIIHERFPRTWDLFMEMQ